MYIYELSSKLHLQIPHKSVGSACPIGNKKEYYDLI